MKKYRFIEKLRIFSGITAALIVLVSLFLFTIFIVNKDPKPSDANSFAIILLFVSVCSIATAFGTYYDVVNLNKFALISLCVTGGIVIIVLGIFGLFVYSWAGPIFGLWTLSPVILSAITIILVLKDR